MLLKPFLESITWSMTLSKIPSSSTKKFILPLKLRKFKIDKKDNVSRKHPVYHLQIPKIFH